jgi:hypothetical protein
VNSLSLIAAGVSRLEQRYAAMERAQAKSFDRERANRMAHMLSAMRRMKDARRVCYAQATRSPFSTE